MLSLVLGTFHSAIADNDQDSHWLEDFQDDMELFSFDGYRLQRYRSPTPPHSEHATTLNAHEAMALLTDSPEVILLDVQPVAWSGEFLHKKGNRRANIQGSTWLPNVGLGELEQGWTEYYEKHLERLTAGDKSHPIILYCTADCWMSWNAIKRANEWGYQNLYWLRNGTDGWLEADFEVVTATPEPFPYRDEKK